MRQFYKEDNEPLPAYKFETEKPEGYTLETNEDVISNLILGQYELREMNGLDYANQFRAKKVMEVSNGTYTMEEIIALESKLDKLMTLVKGGNFITAQSVVSSLSVSGIFTLDMKDEIKLFIDTYVTESY